MLQYPTNDGWRICDVDEVGGRRVGRAAATLARGVPEKLKSYLNTGLSYKK